ncbi:MAG TPA: NAD(P)H-hydrate dehydratase [Rectinemataceae bacterium]
MKPLLDFGEAKKLDDETNTLFSLGSGILVEKASIRLWDAMARWMTGAVEGMKGVVARPEFSRWPPRIVALCGKGANGSDALAMLRHAASAGFDDITALLSPDRLEADPDPQTRSLVAAGVKILRWADLKGSEIESILATCDIVLDGILGTGASGPPRKGAKLMIETLLSLRGKRPRPFIASVDIPSGLDDSYEGAWPCVQADLTLALEPGKLAHYGLAGRVACGSILPVADVFPARLVKKLASSWLLEQEDLPKLLPRFPSEAYKSTRGRLAIFAGSDASPGAARLCVKGAAASGAGYITLYTETRMGKAILPDVESAVLKPLDAFDPAHPGCDAVLAGPGWEVGQKNENLLRLLLDLSLPLALDAGALRILACTPELVISKSGPRLLTPHTGEFESLWEATQRSPSEKEERGIFRRLSRLSSALGSAILLKSHVSAIVDCSRRLWSPGSGEIRIWDGMTPELGTAGSGDVLAGLVAGILAGSFARSPDRAKIVDAASCAVIAHGLAGRRLGEERGWFEASDLPSACAKIMHDAASLSPSPDTET